MRKINIYCFTVENYKVLNKLPKNIIPFGLGKNIFPNHWLNELKKDNIHQFNKYFGEATGIYWVWKNLLSNFSNDDFIGFCQYRRLWLNGLFVKKQKKTFHSLNSQLIKSNNEIFNKCESVLIQPINFKEDTVMNQFKKNYGNEILNDCIKFLDIKDRKDFQNYLEGNSLSICNMFITKPRFFNQYCNDMFKWIFECYEYCKNKNLLYGHNVRLPIFLVERFTSFWFHKYTKVNYLSFARLGRFYLSNNINKILNPLKIPFTFRMYPTFHKY